MLELMKRIHCSYKIHHAIPLLVASGLVQSNEHRQGESGKRALKMGLSDGHRDVAAFEYRRLPDLKLADLTRGLKLMITNPVSSLSNATGVRYGC